MGIIISRITNKLDLTNKIDYEVRKDILPPAAGAVYDLCRHQSSDDCPSGVRGTGSHILVDGVLKFQALVDYFGSYALVEITLLLLVILPTMAVYRFTKANA